MAHPIIHHSKRILNKPHIVVPVAVAVALLIGGAGYLAFGTSKHYTTAPVVLGTVSSDLSSAGAVKAATETDLAFPKGGRVSAVYAAVGKSVSRGQTLAALDSSDAQGLVGQAQGAYDAAQASYDRLIHGAASPDVAIAASAVQSAKVAYDGTVAEQNLAVESARQKLFSGDLAAAATAAAGTSAPIISGTYTGKTEGSIAISVHPSNNSGFFAASGLAAGTGLISSQSAQPIGTSGLSILFPTDAAGTPGTWTISIPNTSGQNYTANNAAYQAALQTRTDKIAQAEAALDQANAALTKVQSAPRTEDVTAAAAEVAAARGALQAAQGALANDFITAPINGIITSVNSLSAGEIVSANNPVIGIMSEGAFQIESYVSEKDLALVSVGEPVSIVTDAYGPNVTFKGSVIEVAPAATAQTNGQLGYKVTYQFTDTDSRIKPGLSATVNLSGATKDNVLAIPRTALFLKNGASFVLVKKGKTTEDRAIAVGLIGSDRVEVVSGLTAGEQVVTLGQ